MSHTAGSGPVIGTNLLGGNATITLMGGRSGANGDTFLMYDNVRFDGVPEPATMTMLGLGAIGVLVRRRRK